MGWKDLRESAKFASYRVPPDGGPKIRQLLALLAQPFLEGLAQGWPEASSESLPSSPHGLMVAGLEEALSTQISQPQRDSVGRVWK